MIKYDIKQKYIDKLGNTCFNYFTLAIVRDKKIRYEPVRILNITEGTIWIPNFKTFTSADNYICNLPDCEVIKKTYVEEEDSKIYIRCENCAYWKEVVKSFGSSYRTGFCTFWKNMDERTYSDDYCSKGVGKRK